MLEPIKVIVQDFPKFLSEFIDCTICAFKAYAKAKVILPIKPENPMNLKINSVKCSFLDSHIKETYRVKSNVSFGIETSANATINQKGFGESQFEIRIKGKGKQNMKAAGTVKINSIKCSLDPNSFYIGVPVRLRTLDPQTLGELDPQTQADLTVQQM